MCVSLWPQERAQHPSMEHSDLITLDGIFRMRTFLCRHWAGSSSTPAARGPPVLSLLQGSPSADSQAGRAAEGGVRAVRLALRHAPSLEEPGGSSRAGGNEQKHKQRVTSS